MYTAVIIEPRIHPSLFIVLQNFNKNLNDKWNFLVFHGSTNKKYIEDIFKSLNTTKKYTLVNLNKNNLTIKEYNKILYTPLFYRFINTEHFLIFQTDTLISDFHYNNIYKFLEYDYVGAPWRHRNNQIGNGGLSFRRKSKMLELLNNNFSSKVLNINEDLFFSGSAQNIRNIKINKPSFELAKEFSIETIYSQNSFGIHKPWRYLNKNKLQLLNKTFPNLNNLINSYKSYNNQVVNPIYISRYKLNTNKQIPIKKEKLNTKIKHKIKSNKIERIK